MCVSLGGGAWGSLGFSAHRTNTNNRRNGTDSLLDALLPNYKPAFNKKGGKLTSRIHVPLAWGVEIDVSGSFAKDRFQNPNLIDALTTIGTPHRRVDRVHELGVTLSRKIFRNLTLEARWRGIDHSSNVKAYNYTRQIMSFYLRAEY